MSEALAVGISGIQQGLATIGQAASQLSQVPSRVDSANQPKQNEGSEAENQKQQNKGQSVSAGDLASNVVALKQGESQVEASTQVVKAAQSADNTLGTLLDVEA